MRRGGQGTLCSASATAVAVITVFCPVGIDGVIIGNKNERVMTNSLRISSFMNCSQVAPGGCAFPAPARLPPSSAPCRGDLCSPAAAFKNLADFFHKRKRAAPVWERLFVSVCRLGSYLSSLCLPLGLVAARTTRPLKLAQSSSHIRAALELSPVWGASSMGT